MNIFIQTFNPFINSKTGIKLPEGQIRGTPDWQVFEDILIDCLNRLGHRIFKQIENPLTCGTIPYDFNPHKSIYVHKCKRDIPSGDLFYMQMHLRSLFTLDTNGWGADHSGIDLFHPDIIDEYDAIQFCRNLSDKLFASGESKCVQCPISESGETPSKFILVPIQIPRDYTIIHHSPITVKYFIDSVSAWAEESMNHIVFKMHPFNKHDHDLTKAVDDSLSSYYCHKSEGNIHELIKRATGLFVINSGTGFEALLHGKPVSTFGNCDYNRVSFNADIRRLDEARNFIYSYREEFRILAYKFVWWYIHKHGYDIHADNTPERLQNYLKGIL